MRSAVQSAESPASRAAGVFQSTLWTQVRLAGRAETPHARQALEELCRVYWPPIYAYLRRSGHDRHDAKDLTQSFFLYVLERQLLRKADPDQGRFRSFLLGSLKLFVSNEQAKERALKRGGGVCFVMLDADREEDSAGYEPGTNLTPERLFERKWALAVVGQAMQRLEAEYGRAGLAEEFELIRPYLAGDPDEHLSDLAQRLGKNAGATRVLMFRMRNRLRRLIRAVIADTVPDVQQVESELQHLEAALAGD